MDNVKDTIDGDRPPDYQIADESIDITAAFSNLDLASKTKDPTAGTCLAHLKVLEAFQVLRDDISSHNGAFGIYDPDPVNANAASQSQKEVIYEKRWAVFVTNATLRFRSWWEDVVDPGSSMMNYHWIGLLDTGLIGLEEWSGFTTDPSRGLNTNKVNEDSAHRVQLLPPLDVLMVWHAFMLNPRNYLQDCMRWGKKRLWQTGMPWQTVAAAIDNDTFAYTVPKTDRHLWESKARTSWDQDIDSTVIQLPCVNCHRTNEVPWTSMFVVRDLYTSDVLPKGSGYTDPDFECRCQCGVVMTHENMKAWHFYLDLDNLMKNHVPMPGTILHQAGYVGKSEPARGSSEESTVIYPNKLLTSIYGAMIKWKITGGSYFDPNTFNSASVEQIRLVIEAAMGIARRARSIRTAVPMAIFPGNRLAVRRMMAAYWDNSSVFCMDLVGAVIRQGTFVQKMHEIDWLHSPSARSTMDRLLVKYSRFFRIMATHPKQMAVPTLDVDLAWHTHQLNPPSYYQYSLDTTNGHGKTYIDHDDKVEDNKLSEAFAWTSKTYMKLFNESYSECTCWYCEAIREAARPSGLTSLFSRDRGQSASRELARLHEPNSSVDIRENVHISNHNAVTTKDQRLNNVHMRTHQAWIKRHAKNAQKHMDRLGIKRGETEKTRSEKGATSSGHPSDAYYYPYMAYPYIPGVYVVTPGCASFTSGAAGNCCRGTCGGGVAAGSCASAACGSGGMGGAGCGGGSGGSGGCGGGGGGGGCGGGGGG